MLIVRGNSLSFNGKTYRCSFGKNGFSTAKKEGDNCTPIGEFYLREVLYRSDNITKPETKLPVSKIAKDDGWCDAPDDANYNKKIKTPYVASHEKLWRNDDIYNLIIPIGYNDDPIIPGKGSAIFLHLARPDYPGTEGCIALNETDLREILIDVNPSTKINLNHA